MYDVSPLALVFLSVNGCIDWSNQLYFVDEVFSQAERVDAVQNLYLSEFVFGMMFFWDLPTSLLSKELRDVPMVLHHVGMVLVSAVAMGVLSDGRPLLGYYAPFFFGLIEVSSVPLVLVDMFHPKHKEWSAYLQSEASPFLHQMNETCRIVFAASFLALRALYFPFETVMGVVPDLMAYRRSGTDMPTLPLDILVVTNLLFSMLQLYWGFLIVRTLIKMLSGISSKSKTK